MSKGSARRKADRRYCSREQEEENWERAFCRRRVRMPAVRLAPEREAEFKRAAKTVAQRHRDEDAAKCESPIWTDYNRLPRIGVA